MNMISSEQQVAWETQKALHPYVEEMIVSGIPDEECDRFLARNTYGTLLSIVELSGWHGFIFSQPFKF